MDANGKPGEETGDSNTGRWSKEEHQLFLRGLNEYGRDWKQIGSIIKSRTVVQIRTHAQKYFLANRKSEVICDHSSDVMITKSSSKKRNNHSVAKGKAKKKKELDDGLDKFEKCFDLIEAWSSGSDEGTPTSLDSSTSLDDIDFLKASLAQDTSRHSTPRQSPTIPLVETVISSESLIQNNHLRPETIQMPIKLESSFFSHPQRHSLVSGRYTSAGEVRSSAHDVHQSVVRVSTPELPDLDPLPPTLEHVFLGRWMDTMTE